MTGVDYIPALLQKGWERAQAEGMTIDSLVVDADALPVPDASFDAVLLTYSEMFVPNQSLAARELLRKTPAF